MGQLINTYYLFKFFKSNKIWIVLFLLLISVAVFQDYLFSRLQHTGFYISESLLYNVLWILTIPFIFFEFILLRKLSFTRKTPQIISTIAISTILSLTQILLSALFFVTISYFVFSPTHRFDNIFNAYLSNQFFILFLIYLIAPFVESAIKTFQNKTTSLTIKYSNKIKVKIGTKMVMIKTDSIYSISTDKPYSTILTDNRTYIDDRSLRAFEALLNPKDFIRVHRSTIINLNHIKQLSSRKNGDYDAVLVNGGKIRMSRHYRKNWNALLQ
ncbi:LytR/AlgR family response regulator transcription factor [Sungkyunkwania multivorans]|uniref:LytR/AlgR family response regulator transcription factor n=2 Tax=Flavobacteriaceae TaxID=49546 RepID=A0ABW3D5M4_9FLAO